MWVGPLADLVGHLYHVPLVQDGAMMAGVHASFGVPVIQDNTVFVLVFYSRRSVQVNNDVLDFIRRSTASWRIQTTFTPEARALQSSTSLAQIGTTAASSSSPSSHLPSSGSSQRNLVQLEQHAI